VKVKRKVPTFSRQRERDRSTYALARPGDQGHRAIVFGPTHFFAYSLDL
jgi:hypothetical protein